ncbi:hypothetical protein DOM22_14005 [Bdellovibrio sp. ZAP7]|nr:hypothetical protein DOM22_14005 [Bdellovibrio sp. ZAP7]
MPYFTMKQQNYPNKSNHLQLHFPSEKHNLNPIRQTCPETADTNGPHLKVKQIENPKTSFVN